MCVCHGHCKVSFVGLQLHLKLRRSQGSRWPSARWLWLEVLAASAITGQELIAPRLRVDANRKDSSGKDLVFHFHGSNQIPSTGALLHALHELPKHERRIQVVLRADWIALMN